MILHTDENIDHKLIWNVVETLIEVAYAALRVLLENFELGILLVQLVGDGAADNVCQHRFKRLLITVVILDGQHEARIVMALLLALHVCLLAHHPDRLVGSLYLDGFDLADGNAIDHSRLRMLGVLSLNGRLFRLDRFGGKVSSSTCVCEALVDSLSLAHRLMAANYALRCHLLSGLIWNSLQLLVLHLSGDGLTGVLRDRIVLVTQQLLLYWLHFIIDSVTVTQN